MDLFKLLRSAYLKTEETECEHNLRNKKDKVFLNVYSGWTSRAGGEKLRSTKGWWTFDRCWYSNFISSLCILSVEHWLSIVSIDRLIHCFCFVLQNPVVEIRPVSLSFFDVFAHFSIASRANAISLFQFCKFSFF